jgi:hypothetical protein
MIHLKNGVPRFYQFALGSLLTIAMLSMGSVPAFCQKAETIEATAMGTGTQLGQNVGVKLIIYDY